ncbi:MAG TPA: DNA recombination protein RmuC [Candidatus Saccharimonadales bacterium]
MELTLLFILIAVIVIGFVVMVAVLFTKLRGLNEQQSAQLLKQDLSLLSKDLLDLRESLTEKLGDRLDRNHQFVSSTMQKQFAESAKIIGDITQRLTKLDETNKRVVDVADELKTLQNVLQNPKQRGVLGEYFLQTVLENVLPNDRFSLQYKFKDGEVVDACIFLDKGKILPIDSKFSLENYNRLVEEPDKTRRELLAKQIKNDLKLRIDETAKYIRPHEGTMDFAFMFIPSEAVYYDLLINKVGVVNASARDLIEYAFRDKHVIIVSPTSFMAYLQTVLQGLRSLQIEEQAKEIQVRVGQLGRHLETYEMYMQKLGNSLSTSVGHYNTAHKELKKIDKDIIKIAGSTAHIEPILVDKPLHND